MYHCHTKCRACNGTDLVPVLDLGIQPLANDFCTADGERAGMAPLKVLFCRTCTLAQLSVVVKPEILYRNYSYVTSASDTMKEHFDKLLMDIANEKLSVMPIREIRAPIQMLEIGSNNGEFLKEAQSRGVQALGIEPAKNLASIANERGIKTIDRLFGEPSAIELAATGYRADIIVARHVFAHIDDWKGFVNAIQFISHKDTLVVIEVPYVGDMLAVNSFDQIYHEHLSYVSVTAIMSLLKDTKFYLSKVVKYQIHGGAIALMLRHVEHETSIDQLDKAVRTSLQCGEKNLEERWKGLALDVGSMISQLSRIVASKKGKSICGFGASAKATVWLNACGFTSKDIAFVCDSTEQKQGKFVPGTDIPVVAESELMKADYSICFSWNFLPEIRAKFKAFEDKGGRWILPVPEVRIVE